MASLKGTKTHQNLKDAVASESQANRRYLYFAKIADIEGQPDIAGLFRDTAEGETGHAHGHLDYLKSVGAPATGLPMGDSSVNLKSAIAGETHEYTDMYPGMAKVAREEGFTEIADWFETLAKAEGSHANRFQKALDPLGLRVRCEAGPSLTDPKTTGSREGSLQAPIRHPLKWREASFYDEAALEQELQRVFDICHGCRRCFNLCQAFPTLFDAIDASATQELSGVDKRVYWQVVDNCYLCDICFSTKCPYVPPHPWNVDFPHLMLRAKAVKNRGGGMRWRDKVLSSTDMVGTIAGIPVVAEIVNAVNRSPVG